MLSDPKQREEYDAIRQMAHGGARFRAGGPGGNGGFEDVFSAFGGGAAAASACASPPAARAGGAGQPDLDDLLAQMFGGAAAGAGGARARVAPTRSPGSARRAARGPAPTCRPAPR